MGPRIGLGSEPSEVVGRARDERQVVARRQRAGQRRARSGAGPDDEGLRAWHGASSRRRDGAWHDGATPRNSDRRTGGLRGAIPSGVR